MRITGQTFFARTASILMLCQALTAGYFAGQLRVMAEDTSDEYSGVVDEAGDAIESINEGLNSNEGGTAVGITKDTLDHGLNTAATGQHGAAWQGNKMGASPQTTAGHLEIKDGLKNASGLLSTGGTLIDHSGYTSTAAGEVAGGRYGQAVITVIDGIGKAATSFVGATIGGGLGSAGGPAGTIAGGAAGGYAGSSLWDKTGGKLTAAIKDRLGKQEDKKTYGEMFGAKIPAGMTPEQIHAAWIVFKDKMDKQKLADKADKSNKGDLQGNEATSKGSSTGSGSKSKSSGGGLDGLISDKTSKADSKKQSSYDGMKNQADLSKASTAGDKKVKDAKDLKNKAGVESQQKKSDSANQTANADKKDSVASTLTDAVAKGLAAGGAATGAAIGTAAGSKAVGDIFGGGSSGTRKKDETGDKKGDVPLSSGAKDKKPSSGNKPGSSSSSGTGGGTRADQSSSSNVSTTEKRSPGKNKPPRAPKMQTKKCNECGYSMTISVGQAFPSRCPGCGAGPGLVRVSCYKCSYVYVGPESGAPRVCPRCPRVEQKK